MKGSLEDCLDLKGKPEGQKLGCRQGAQCGRSRAAAVVHTETPQAICRPAPTAASECSAPEHAIHRPISGSTSSQDDACRIDSFVYLNLVNVKAKNYDF